MKGPVAALGLLTFFAVVMMMSAAFLARQIEPVTVTSSVWATSTIPLPTTSSTTSTSLPQSSYSYQHREDSVKPLELSVSEWCALAERSPSGEGLIFGVFYDPIRAENHTNWSESVDNMYQSLQVAIATQPCSEYGNRILRDAYPFTQEAQG